MSISSTFPRLDRFQVDDFLSEENKCAVPSEGQALLYLERVGGSKGASDLL